MLEEELHLQNSGSIFPNPLQLNYINLTKENVNTLVADIGGTNGRFGICSDTSLHSVESKAVAAFPSMRSLVRHYLDTLPRNMVIRKAVLAIAGPVIDQTVHMTNLPWRISGSELEVAFGFDHVELINDFEAIANCVPALQADDLIKIGPGKRREEAPSVILGRLLTG